jgi:hypothetical protein
MFNEKVEIQRVVKIPHEIIHKYATFRTYVHAHILLLRANILSDPLTEDITHLFYLESSLA